jgi:hypothetical protein
MEIECVLLLSDHYKWIVPFYESALSRPKWSAKSALSLASHKRKGAVKLYSAQEKLQSAVLSEVLNGTDHLRGVGVLVVVPGHDLNLIGVVAATLNFCTFPSSSSQFRNNSYSTRTYRCRTKTGLFVPQLYHVSASFARIQFVSLMACIFQISAYIFTTFHGASAGAAALPSTLLRSSMTARLPTCSC